MREDAIFRLYSMTKPVTAVALLMLLEEGRIALDDPVAKFIPGFADLKLADGSGARRAMTVLDLLRHTAGLTYGFHNRTPIDAAYRALRIAEMDTEGGLAGDDRATGEACRWNIRRARPGSIRWRPMCWAIWCRSYRGQSYADFVREHILTPLKMTDTDFVVPRRKRDRFAACYALKDGRAGTVRRLSQRKLFRAAQAGIRRRRAGGHGGRLSALLPHAAEQGRTGWRAAAEAQTVALMTRNQLPGGKEIADLSPAADAFNESGYRGIGFGLGVAVTLDPGAGRHSRHRGRIRLGRHGLHRLLCRSQGRHGRDIHDPGDHRHGAAGEAAPRLAHPDL